jgi:large subunit ribosomal protein L10
MPNAEKQQIVAELRDIVAQSKGAILTDYRGLTVAEVSTLRKRLRAVDAEYHIVKNTLFKIALGDTLNPDLEQLLSGPTAIAFARNDVVAPTKTMFDFLRELRKPEIKVKGGFIDGKVYSVDQVTALSKLPPREQLIGQVVGTIQAPLSEFVGTLDNILGEFVRTIQAIADKQGGAEAPAA